MTPTAVPMCRFINWLLVLANIANAVLTGMAFGDRIGILAMIAFMHTVITIMIENIFFWGKRVED